MKKIRICTTCGKDVEECKDMFDFYRWNEGDKKAKLMHKKVRVVWGNGFSDVKPTTQKEGLEGMTAIFEKPKKISQKKLILWGDRPRPERLQVGENAPMKRCRVHIWKRKSKPKKCKNCGTMKV